MTLLGLLLVLAWALVLFFPVLLGGETFSRGDLVFLHRPLRTLLVHLWRESPGFPLWNPYFNSGQPFAANPHAAVFYPLSWLFLVLPWETAFRLQVLVPVGVTLAAMVFLLRELGMRREVALFGGCVWAFGGYLVSVTELLPILFSVAPVPAVLAFTVRVLRGGRRRDALWLALAFGLECAGGEPCVFVATAFLLVAVTADVWLESKRGASRNEDRGSAPSGLQTRTLVVLGALALGTVMAAAVLVPAWHLEGEGARGQGLPAAVLSDWSLSPIRLLEPVLPRLLGSGRGDGAVDNWGAALYPGHRRPLIVSLYLGLVPLALALAAATLRWRRCWPWTALAVLGLVLAFGDRIPLWNEIAGRLPVLHSLRYPERWVLLPAFAAVVLACRGLQRLLDGEEGVVRAVVRLLVAFAALAVGAGVAVWLVTAALGVPAWTRLGLTPQSTGTFARFFPAGCLVQGAIAFLGLAAVVLLRRRSGAPAGLLLLLVVAGDLIHANRPLVATARPQDLDTPPAFLVPLLAAGPGPRLLHLASCEKRCTDLLTPVQLAAPPMPARWLIPLAFQPDFDLLEPRWSSEHTSAVISLAEQRSDLAMPLLARCGVGSVLDCPAQRIPEDAQSVPGGVPIQLKLLTVPGPRPTVSCVDRVIAVGDARQWHAAAVRLGGSVRDAALVDDSRSTDLPKLVSPCLVTMGAATPVNLHARIAAQGPAPSFLAVNVTWDEGWRAVVDGRPSPLLRTDLSLMGLVVAPGKHSVELSYRDPWVSRGVTLSLAGIAAWLVALALTRRRWGTRPDSG